MKVLLGLCSLVFWAAALRECPEEYKWFAHSLFSIAFAILALAFKEEVNGGTK